MKNIGLKIGHVPLVKKSWLNDNLEKTRAEAEANLRKAGLDICAGPLVMDMPGAAALAERFKKEGVDCLLFHNITFSLGGIVPFMVEALGLPAIFWSMPEPPMEGGRLSSNSFCATNMNAHTLWRMGRKYAAVHGTFETAADELKSHFNVLGCLKSLRATRLGVVGGRVPGFYTSNFDELRLRSRLGVETEKLDLLELVEEAKAADAGLAGKKVSDIRASAKVSANVTDGELEKAARLFLGFKRLAEKHSLDAFSARCWPELPEFYGIAPCSVLGMLADDGIVAGCEGDTLGTVTMLIQEKLARTKPFFCDIISLDHERNEAVAWHCGAAAPSLKSEKFECEVCRHSIVDGGGRKGLTNEFPLRKGKATVMRLGEDKGSGYRLFAAAGEALDTSLLLRGNPLRVRFASPLKKIADAIVDNGFEHHYSLAHADLSSEAEKLCGWLDMEKHIF